MADSNKKNKAPAPEKTLGKEPAAENANGAPPPPAPEAEAVLDEDAVADHTAAFEQAREELSESFARLKQEVAAINVAEARQRARDWVAENPVLAAALAIGAGLVLGRILTKAFTPAPPPTLPERIRRRSRSLASQAEGFAHDVGDALTERAADAADAVNRHARDFSDDVARRARALSEDVARRAQDVAATTSEHAADLGEAVVERSSRAARGVREAARDKKSEGFDLAETLLNAAKTITAALVVKKITGWFRS